MKRRDQRKSKGISTVIATLLMIVVAVAGSLVTYAWVSGYIGFTTNKAGNALQIQSVATNSSAKTITAVYVQNVGQNSVPFGSSVTLYINGASQAFTGAPTSLGMGSTATLTLSTAFSYSGLTGGVQVKVVGVDGSVAQNTFYP
jgi:FlaG/FlaF family flagellin (archaellin)